MDIRETMLQKLQTSFLSLQQQHKNLKQEISNRQEAVNQLQEQLLVSEESSRNLDSEVSLTADQLILTNVLA